MRRTLVVATLTVMLMPAVARASLIVDVTTSQFTVAGLQCGTTYTVTLATTSSSSETLTQRTADCPLPAPTADLTVTPNPAQRTIPTTFSSTGDCQATPCTYRWFHGDASSTDEIESGATQPNMDTQFTYTGPAGQRTITLKVTDVQGRQSSRTRTFDLVEPVDPTPPPSGSWPDASSTGVPFGTALASYPNGMHITTSGVTVNAVKTPYIVIDANNVTVQNSSIGPGGIGVNVNSGTGTVVKDTTIYCGQGVAAVAFNNYTALRVNASGCENGFRAGSNVTIRDSWIHDLTIGSTQHNDGIDSDGPSSNVVIDHNSINSHDTSAIIMYTKTDAANRNWTITGNYLNDPDNIDLYCNRVRTTGITVTGNTFKKPVRGSMRHTDSCSLPAGTVNVWSGNVDADTGATVPANDPILSD